MSMIPIQNIILGQFEKDKFVRYDIVIKYLFIEKYYKKNKPDHFNFKMYDKIYLAKNVSKKHIRHEYELFTTLIESFEKYGFNKEYPISMTEKYHMCGGSHRIACSLWFGIDKIPVVFNEKCKNDRKRRHSRKWMKEHGFLSKIKFLEKTKKHIFDKIGICK